MFSKSFCAQFYNSFMTFCYVNSNVKTWVTRKNLIHFDDLNIFDMCWMASITIFFSIIGLHSIYYCIILSLTLKYAWWNYDRVIGILGVSSPLEHCPADCGLQSCSHLHISHWISNCWIKQGHEDYSMVVSRRMIR